MTRYNKHADMGNGWTDWIQPVMKGYKMSCCDCGLVHNLDFRIGRITKVISPGTYRSVDAGKKFLVQFRVSRNARSTAMVRRHKKKKR